MRHRGALTTTVLLFSLLAALPVSAERLGYPPEEFIARRQALAKALGEGLVLLLGKTLPANATRFHQDNDFYYLTGNEDLNAVLVMDAKSGAAHLFLPRQSEREIRADGANWLSQGEAAAKRWGFASIQPLDMAPEFLARRRVATGPQTLWVRLSEADEVDDARGDRAIAYARRMQNPFVAVASEQALQIEHLRRTFPYYELKDLTRSVDALRMIKTPREIEVLTHNGRIAAEAIVNAIKATRPGRYEYEIEAEATYHHVRHGVQIAGYPAIVGSGPNGLAWHYQSNGRRVRAGETIVMDYGGALDYQVIDITRTWPVSGAFDDLQRRAYACVLEAQKAVIAAMRPGVTRAKTREIAEAVFKRHGFDGRYAGGAGHFVGMSVHDAGDYSLPLQAGMVIAVEPILEIKEHDLHVRIEDTVLVTQGEPINLTAAAPKEIDELLALMTRPAPSSASWTPQTTGRDVTLRGVSAVDERVAWASGSAGTILRTADGGVTWRPLAVPGGEGLDFRDVDAIDTRTAYALSIGPGAASRIYKTGDAGATWQLQFTNDDPKAFYDAVAFWDERRGIAFSDSVDGRFVILTTEDGGRRWTRVAPDRLPAALPNEGAFAASGTNVAVWGKDHVWIGTGAAGRARVLRSSDRGRTWQVAETPLASGRTTGIFSIAFRDARNGIVVGGDFTSEDQARENVAVTRDGGATWTLVTRDGGASALSGFRSLVTYVPGTTSVLAVGPNGADLSTDDGRTWAPVGGPGYHTFSFAPGTTVGWGAGSNGRVGRFTMARTKPSAVPPTATR